MSRNEGLLVKKLKSYDLVVCDFDETVATLAVDWASVYQELKILFWDRYGQTFQSQRVHGLIGEAMQLCGEEAKQLAYPVLCHYEVGADYVVNESLAAYLRETMQQVAILSNNTCQALQPILKEMGLDTQVGVLVGYENLPRFKPYRDGMDFILKELSIEDVSRVIFVGDKDTDEQVAQAMKMDFCYVDELV